MTSHSHQLIRDIFNRIPAKDRGINKDGHHVVFLQHLRMPMYATLERLNSETLSRLSKSVSQVSHRELA